MILLILRIALTALAVGFLGWISYILYLGLKSFFEMRSFDSSHRKRRGGTAPNRALKEGENK